MRSCKWQWFTSGNDPWNISITLSHTDSTPRRYRSCASRIFRGFYRDRSPSPSSEKEWLSIDSFSRDERSKIDAYFHVRRYNCDFDEAMRNWYERILQLWQNVSFIPTVDAWISPLSTSLILISDFMILLGCVYAEFIRSSPLSSLNSQRKPSDRVS